MEIIINYCLDTRISIQHWIPQYQINLLEGLRYLRLVLQLLEHYRNAFISINQHSYKNKIQLDQLQFLLQINVPLHCQRYNLHKYNISIHMSTKPITLDRTISWLNKTEARDKFCKAIQYASRMLKYKATIEGNKESALKFDGLFVGMRNARKLFRLFKSINEYQKLVEILGKKGSTFDKTFNVLNRIFFLLYWIFDNIAILATLKFIKVDPAPYNKKASTFWLLALIAGFVSAIKEILVIRYKVKETRKKLKDSTFSEQDSQNYNVQKQLIQKFPNAVLNLLKILGDMIPAAQGAQVWEKIFGAPASDGLAGFGGLVSALITSYQLYD